jgi:hypothetical protein
MQTCVFRKYQNTGFLCSQATPRVKKIQSQGCRLIPAHVPNHLSVPLAIFLTGVQTLGVTKILLLVSTGVYTYTTPAIWHAEASSPNSDMQDPVTGVDWRAHVAQTTTGDCANVLSPCFQNGPRVGPAPTLRPDLQPRLRDSLGLK